MWHKSIPKRAFKLSLYVSMSIFLIVLIQAFFVPVEGTPIEIVIRFVEIVVALSMSFWAFFTVYLYFQPNFDGYLDKHGGDGYGS